MSITKSLPIDFHCIVCPYKGKASGNPNSLAPNIIQISSFVLHRRKSFRFGTTWDKVRQDFSWVDYPFKIPLLMSCALDNPQNRLFGHYKWFLSRSKSCVDLPGWWSSILLSGHESLKGCRSLWCTGCWTAAVAGWPSARYRWGWVGSHLQKLVRSWWLW